MNEAPGTPPCLSEALPPRRGRLVFLAWAAIMGAGLSILFLFNPSQYGWYPQCTLYRVTGLQCPGCGSLRAIHQLLHGNIAEAARLNLLMVLSLPLLAWWGIRALRRLRRGKADVASFNGAVFWVGLAVFVLFGICRNLPSVAAWLARI